MGTNPGGSSPNILIKYLVPVTRITVSYGNDGSLESRLYLTSAGKDEAGNYSCHLPVLGTDQQVANIALHVTQGKT